MDIKDYLKARLSDCCDISFKDLYWFVNSAYYLDEDKKDEVYEALVFSPNSKSFWKLFIESVKLEDGVNRDILIRNIEEKKGDDFCKYISTLIDAIRLVGLYEIEDFPKLLAIENRLTNIEKLEVEKGSGRFEFENNESLIFDINVLYDANFKWYLTFKANTEIERDNLTFKFYSNATPDEKAEPISIAFKKYKEDVYIYEFEVPEDFENMNRIEVTNAGDTFEISNLQFNELQPSLVTQRAEKHFIRKEKTMLGGKPYHSILTDDVTEKNGKTYNIALTLEGKYEINGYNNTFIGINDKKYNKINGDNNTIVSSFFYTPSAHTFSGNTILGYGVGTMGNNRKNTAFNVILGAEAGFGRSWSTASNSIIIGSSAPLLPPKMAHYNPTGLRCRDKLIIGSHAHERFKMKNPDYEEGGDEPEYIPYNSSEFDFEEADVKFNKHTFGSTPLIFGDFVQEWVSIQGDFILETKRNQPIEEADFEGMQLAVIDNVGKVKPVDAMKFIEFIINKIENK